MTKKEYYIKDGVAFLPEPPNTRVFLCGDYRTAYNAFMRFNEAKD